MAMPFALPTPPPESPPLPVSAVPLELSSETSPGLFAIQTLFEPSMASPRGEAMPPDVYGLLPCGVPELFSSVTLVELATQILPVLSDAIALGELMSVL